MNRKLKSVLSSVLAVIIVLLCLPLAVNAEGATATRITSKDALTSGKYVIVSTNGRVVTVLDGTWLLSDAFTAGGDTLSGVASNRIWTVTVNGSSVTLTDPNGVTVAPKGGNNNGIKAADYKWTVSFEGGTFSFAGVGDDTVKLATNNEYDFKLRGYKTTTVEGQYADGYCATFNLYKVSDGASAPETGAPDTEEPAVGAPETNAPAVSPSEITIPEALALDDGAEVIVSGTVTDIGTPWNDNFGNISVTITDNDGNSLYLYRLATKVELGDIITVTGNMATYNNARQVAAGASAKIIGKAEIDEPEYRLVSIPEALTLEDGEYVTVKGKVKEINTEWNDQYENITVTIEDEDGNTLYVYRLSTNVQIDDRIIITGKIGSYNGEKQIAAGATAVLDNSNTPETNAPETNAPETNAPETNAPETNAPETNAPAGEITDIDDLVSGKYVIVATNGYVMTVLDDTWVLSSLLDSSAAIESNRAWSITVNGNSVVLTDSNGAAIAPKGGNNNGIKTGEYQWLVSFENGVFSFAGVGDDTVKLAVNGSYENKIRAYKLSTIEGEYANGYCATFRLYKIGDASDLPETEKPETSAPETNASETNSPESALPETNAPAADDTNEITPETDRPETSSPETRATESGDIIIIAVAVAAVVIVAVGAIIFIKKRSK